MVESITMLVQIAIDSNTETTRDRSQRLCSGPGFARRLE